MAMPRQFSRILALAAATSLIQMSRFAVAGPPSVIARIALRPLRCDRQRGIRVA